LSARGLGRRLRFAAEVFAMGRFLRVKCECGNEQNIFGNSSTVVKCMVCNRTLAEPTGSRAKVHGKIVKVL